MSSAVNLQANFSIVRDNENLGRHKRRHVFNLHYLRCFVFHRNQKASVTHRWLQCVWNITLIRCERFLFRDLIMTLPRVYKKKKLSYNVEIKRGLLCANILSGSESVPKERNKNPSRASLFANGFYRMAQILVLKKENSSIC